MRLDKCTREVSRVIKRRPSPTRSPTRAACSSTANPKACYTVKVGDIIEVTFGNRPVKIHCLSDVEQRQGRRPKCLRVIEG